jgi:hypothetical protein
MPEICRFFGIVIVMYHNDHPPPHFHARYGEYRAKIDVATGELLEGELPRRAIMLVREWHQLHIAELMIDWTLAQERKQPNKIAPLE